MTKLTREQIKLLDLACNEETFNELKRMALSSLDREGVVVPREPTQEMISAACTGMFHTTSTHPYNQAKDYAIAVYKAMLAAAPQPEPVPIGPVEATYGKPGDSQPPREGKEEE